MGGCHSLEGVVPVVHPAACVHPDAILIGDVHVGPRCFVGPSASLRGDFRPSLDIAPDRARTLQEYRDDETAR